MTNLSLGLAAAALLALCAPAPAEEKASTPTVSVIGEASAEVRPDIAFVSFEISNDRQTPLDASNENARLTGAVIDGLKGSNVDPKDISTVGASLSPVLSEVHDPKTNAFVRNVVTGYHARNVLRVEVRDIDRAGAIIGTSVQNGALYEGVAFDISDRDARLDVLRTKAAANAVHRAGLYAEGAGMKLGAIRALNAAGTPQPYPEPSSARPMAPRAFAAASVPIEPGVVTLSESVDAIFELAAP